MFSFTSCSCCQSRFKICIQYKTETYLNLFKIAYNLNGDSRNFNKKSRKRLEFFIKAIILYKKNIFNLKYALLNCWIMVIYLFQGMINRTGLLYFREKRKKLKKASTFDMRILTGVLLYQKRQSYCIYKHIIKWKDLTIIT